MWDGKWWALWSDTREALYGRVKSWETHKRYYLIRDTISQCLTLTCQKIRQRHCIDAWSHERYSHSAIQFVSLITSRTLKWYRQCVYLVALRRHVPFTSRTLHTVSLITSRTLKWYRQCVVNLLIYNVLSMCWSTMCCQCVDLQCIDLRDFTYPEVI